MLAEPEAVFCSQLNIHNQRNDQIARGCRPRLDQILDYDGPSRL